MREIVTNPQVQEVISDPVVQAQINELLTSSSYFTAAVDKACYLIGLLANNGCTSQAISIIVNLSVIRTKLTIHIDRLEDGKRIRDAWYLNKYGNVDHAIDDLASGDATLRSKGLGVLIDTFDLSIADAALALNSFTATTAIAG